MRFSESLNRAVEEIERPANAPRGHYIFQVTKHPEVDDFTNADGVTSDRVNFSLTAVEPTEDVDPDELVEYGETSNISLRKTIWIPDGSQDKVGHDKGMFQLKQFFKALGQDVEAGNTTIAEAMAASVGCRCIGELIHKPDKEDPEILYDNLGKTAPVE